MRLPLPAWIAISALLLLINPLRAHADDDEVPPYPGMVVEEPIADDPHAHADIDLHEESDFDDHGDHNDFHDRPDSHAPAGVFADHTHEKGEWMVEYRFMYMNMQSMANGTNPVTPQDVFDATGVAVSPTDMNMKMNMGHVMYGLTDDITLVTMFMWADLNMDHVPNPLGPVPVPFTTENSDFGDMFVGANALLCDTCNSEWIGSLGLWLPTGDIGRRIGAGVPPTGQVFPYPMRVGTGSVCIRPALTYKKWNDCGSIGLQALADIPLNENYRDYTVGTDVRVNFWAARLLTEKTSASFRVEGRWIENIDGGDPELNPAQVTTANPLFQGRSNVNLYGGLNTIHCGHRLAVEVGTPVYQNVYGFQLEQDLMLWASWSKAF